ncbi:MAG TPA: universal stress protein [Vicinamibacterales bacterium]
MPGSILCAIDGSTEAPSVVRWAADFANALGARLTVLHVVEPVTDWPSLERERRLQEEVREQARTSRIN